jgi:hypothetical protein
MSIASEITRLQGVKADILQAISDKGVVVPAGSALDDCPGLIGDISGDVSKLSILSLTDNIVNGRVTNTSSTNGVFFIPEFPYVSYDTIERNFRFIINNFNAEDNRILVGEYWTGSLTTYSPVVTSYTPTTAFLGLQGDDDTITGLSFAIDDEIEENLLIDRVNNTIRLKVKKNGTQIIDKTYQNKVVNIGTRKFYVLGLRLETSYPGYNGPGTFIFDGSYIKGDGNLIWGLS